MEIPVTNKILLDSNSSSRTIMLQTGNQTTNVSAYEYPYFECVFLTNQSYLSCKLKFNVTTLPDFEIGVPNVTSNLIDINISANKLIPVVDKNGKLYFILVNGIYGIGNLIISLSENATRNYTFEFLTSNPSVKISPSMVTLHPGESATLTIEASMLPGVPSGIYITTMFVVQKENTSRTVASTFPLRIFVPDLIFMRFSDQPYYYCYPSDKTGWKDKTCVRTYNISVIYDPRDSKSTRAYIIRKALGWHRLGKCVPFNLTIENRYPISVKAYA